MNQHRTWSQACITGAVTSWLTHYVGQPEPELGRDGNVCPFVRPALDVEMVELRVVRGEDCTDADRLHDLAIKAMDGFLAGAGAEDSPMSTLAALLLVLPEASAEGWTLLDRVLPRLKDAAVARCLMVSQFHPACDVRSVRNSRFLVAQAPMAILAIRRMAKHDVLFLHERADWYAVYQSQFGWGAEAQGGASDLLMHEVRQQARERFGSADR